LSDGATTMGDDDDTFTAEQIEAGRLLFARPWQFLYGVTSITQLPSGGDVEVAFAGRSNVGKSSLINALTGRKNLARTSNTPGRTRELNFFSADAGVTIVDMPGYGYARAAKTAVAEWTALIVNYLKGRVNLRRVYVLVDARHGLKDNDLAVLDLLDTTAVSYQIVLTKGDKPKSGDLEKVRQATANTIAKRAAAHPRIIVTSAEKGWGLEQLRAEILLLAK